MSTHAPASLFIPETMEPVWAALTDDTTSGVIVVEPDGTIVFANWLAAQWATRPAHELVGRNLRELWDEAFARERIDLVREAATTGRPITVDGMIQGRWVRMVVRPFPFDQLNRRRVLLVSRVATPADPVKTPADDQSVVRARVDDSGALSQLTNRELQILCLIGAGLSTQQIAKKLHRSVKTVEWHRVSLGNKLGANNRVELARIAIGAGIVDSQSSDEFVEDDDSEA